MLNYLYQLDISIVDICFIYTLKLGIRGQLSMSAHSPWLQFLTGLPNSPKMESKGVVLVKGSWYEMLGSSGFPFDVNQSQTFPSPIDMPLFFFLMSLKVGASKVG